VPEPAHRCEGALAKGDTGAVGLGLGLELDLQLRGKSWGRSREAGYRERRHRRRCWRRCSWQLLPFLRCWRRRCRHRGRHQPLGANLRRQSGQWNSHVDLVRLPSVDVLCDLLALHRLHLKHLLLLLLQ